MITDRNADNNDHHQVQISERRLWAAVLLQAMEDWQSNNRRRQTDAEKFFFASEGDFATVCRGAGLEPSGVLARLQKMRSIAVGTSVTPRFLGDRTSPALLGRSSRDVAAGPALM
jgi:hypothetical protein